MYRRIALRDLAVLSNTMLPVSAVALIFALRRECCRSSRWAADQVGGSPSKMHKICIVFFTGAGGAANAASSAAWPDSIGCATPEKAKAAAGLPREPDPPSS